MTTSTTTTATPASPAAPVSGAAASGTTADPAAAALFTTLLASMGGTGLVEGAAPSATAEDTGLPAGLGAEGDEEASALAADIAAPADLAPVVPSIVLVPIPADPALALGAAAEGTATETAATAASIDPALAGALDTVVAVPVAPVALLAVADAMPEQAAPLPADEPVAPQVDADGGKEGAIPLPAKATADNGPAPIQVPVQTTTAPAAVPAPTPIAPPVAEPAVRPLDGRRPERTTEAADVPAPAVTNHEGQPNAALAGVAVNGGDTIAGTDAPIGATTVDRERFERLVKGLAARLRVSLAGDGARVRMHLTPRELGEVVVRLELKDGLAHAHLIADTREASRMLTAAMGDLRAALADRGIQLDTMDVRVSGDAGGPMHGQAQAQHGQQSQGGERRGRTPFSLDPLGAIAASETPAAPTEAPAAAGVSVLA